MATNLDLPVHQSESARATPAVAVSAPVDKRLVAVILDGVLSVVTLGFGWLVWALVTATSYGQTPGKQLMRLRVVDARTGIQVGFARMFWLRGLAAGTLIWIVLGLLVAAEVAIVAALAVIAVVLLPLVHPQKRSFYDLVSATVVVDAGVPDQGASAASRQARSKAPVDTVQRPSTSRRFNAGPSGRP